MRVFDPQMTLKTSAVATNNIFLDFVQHADEGTDDDTLNNSLKYAASEFALKYSGSAFRTPHTISSKRSGRNYTKIGNGQYDAVSKEVSQAVKDSPFVIPLDRVDSQTNSKPRKGLPYVQDSLRRKKYRDMQRTGISSSQFSTIPSSKAESTIKRRRPLPPIPNTDNNYGALKPIKIPHVMQQPYNANQSYLQEDASTSKFKSDFGTSISMFSQMQNDFGVAERSVSDIDVAPIGDSSRSAKKPDEAQAIWKMIDKMMGAVSQSEVLLAREEMKNAVSQQRHIKRDGYRATNISLSLPRNTSVTRRRLTRRRGRLFIPTESQLGQAVSSFTGQSSSQVQNPMQSVSETSLFSTAVQPKLNQSASPSSERALTWTFDSERLPLRIQRLLFTSTSHSKNSYCEVGQINGSEQLYHPDVLRVVKALREGFQ